jgi:hypothetical protein
MVSHLFVPIFSRLTGSHLIFRISRWCCDGSFLVFCSSPGFTTSEQSVYCKGCVYDILGSDMNVSVVEDVLSDTH